MDDKIISNSERIASLETILVDIKEICKETLTEARKTNGRVTKLEGIINNESEEMKLMKKQTEVVRFLSTHSGILKFVGIGIIMTLLSSIVGMILTFNKLF